MPTPAGSGRTPIGGTPWPIVITEVGGHTLVFENLKGANTLDQSVLDSVRFLDRVADAADVLVTSAKS